jgi:hypothetical protein
MELSALAKSSKGFPMTSQEAFDEICNLVSGRPDMVDVGTPASDNDIKKAEGFLGIKFPDLYVKFLKTWGTLAIGPCEFYGITGTDYENSKIPNGIWFTSVKRKQVGLPNSLVVLCDNDGDEYYSLDAASGKIVTWDVEKRELVGLKSDDIFNFILNEVRDFD